MRSGLLAVRKTGEAAGPAGFRFYVVAPGMARSHPASVLRVFVLGRVPAQKFTCVPRNTMFCV
jgi:hypothetical protein